MEFSVAVKDLKRWKCYECGKYKSYEQQFVATPESTALTFGPVCKKCNIKCNKSLANLRAFGTMLGIKFE